MSNIRVDVEYVIHDGSELKFRSPVDCSAITGLIVYYPGADSNTTSKEFVFADAHGNNVGDIDHLFAENVVVKVILDVTTGMAFVQNADTNAYLEGHIQSKNNPHGVTAEQVGAMPNCIAVTKTGTDLNDYLKEGWYFFASAYVPTNIPIGKNGWLCVSAETVGSATYVKQFWYRAGTPGNNDHQMYVRTYISAAEPQWGEWVKVITEKDTLPTAAPAGYGYGGASVYLGSVTTEDELTNALETLYASMANGETKMIRWYGYPSNEFNFFGILSKSSSNYGSVVVHTAYYRGELCSKTKYGGVWLPIEWDNPPMASGVEYRTTQRRDGKPVYTVFYNVSGTGLTEFAIESVTIPASADVFRIDASDGGMPLPIKQPSGGMDGTTYKEIIVNNGYSYKNIYIFSRTTDWAKRTTKVQVWYTK